MKTPTARALAVSLAYAVIAGAYILGSSEYLGGLPFGSEQQAALESAKGLAFVVVTAGLLLLVLRQQFQSLTDRQRELSARAGELAKAQQRASVAKLAAALAHDMKNVLTIVQAAHEELREKAADGRDNRETLDELGDGIERLRALTQELLARAREETTAHVTRLDLAEVARDCARMARILARAHDCHIEVDAPETCWVQADRRELEYVAVNLVINAIEANDHRGRVTMAVRREHGNAVFRVIDEGPGVPSELHDKIFEPFYTTKGSAGTGLGLPVVRDVVRNYGGDIRVRCTPTGAEFEVVMRARGSTPPPAQSAETAA